MAVSAFWADTRIYIYAPIAPPVDGDVSVKHNVFCATGRHICLITKAFYVHFVWYTRCFVSDGLKLRMPFSKCHFEVYARRFLASECLPTPCFPNMIKK